MNNHIGFCLWDYKERKDEDSKKLEEKYFPLQGPHEHPEEYKIRLNTYFDNKNIGEKTNGKNSRSNK